MTEIKRLIKTATELFQKKAHYHGLWQEIAELCYPERADFTAQRKGKDFARNIMNSHPMIVRRDFSNLMSTMNRPRNQKWFHLAIPEAMEDESDNFIEEKRWLEWATDTMRQSMYASSAQFVRASWECDNDFVAFGNGVISCEFDPRHRSLLYRCWHIRDMAWIEGYDGQICEIYRKCQDTVYNLNKQFNGKISARAKKHLEKNPHTPIDYYHVVLPKDRYTSEQNIATDYVSVFFEVEGEHVLEERACATMLYVISRWQRLSGSCYGCSPATIAALPDTRMLQELSLMILESTEMSVRPPMYTRQEIFRNDINRMAGGVTYLDIEPEQRISEAMMFEPSAHQGLQIANAKEQQVMEMINRAFFLDRLKLPAPMSGTTAYEFEQRLNEHIIANLPIFEPIELNYTQPLCEMTFATLMHHNAFGDASTIPKTLHGADVPFRFESPLQKAIEAQNTQKYVSAMGLIAQAASLDPNATSILKMDALSDALLANGTPAQWLNSRQEMQEVQMRKDQAQQMQQEIALMQQGGEAAQAVGQGAQALGGLV